MIIAAYEVAAFPEPYTILGVKLKPFSLGHFQILRRLKSPFVDDETKTASSGDLILGVIICSRTYADAEALILDLEQLETLAQAMASETGEASIDASDSRDSDEWVIKKIQLFNEYITKGSAMPGYFENPIDGGVPMNMRQHWSQNVYLSLISDCGYTREEAMNAPLSKAFFDHLAFLEKQGAIQIMSQQEIDALNAVGKESNG